MFAALTAVTVIAFTGGNAGMATSTMQILSNTDMAFLEALTAAVFDESRVPAGAKVGDTGPNTTGGAVIRPGGRHDYPAFWIRDYAMSLDVGMVTLEEQRHMLFLTAQHQPDEKITLPTGSVLPPGSIPDHIAFGGAPIFFPGVLEDYNAQGGPRWGLYPCLDDHYFFIHMAAVFAHESGKTDFLSEEVRGKKLWQRLEEAYAVPPARPDTGLVYATEDARGVNFGFFDTTVHTGELLFCSVLKCRAASELAGLLAGIGKAERAVHYREEAQRLRRAISKTFRTESGWLRASTGLSGQYDVWGTAFAVYTGALSPAADAKASHVLADALRQGTIAWKGGIRHVPTGADFSETTAWETSYAAKNRYQNGAYWNTPVGWVCYAVAKVEPAGRAVAPRDGQWPAEDGQWPVEMAQQLAQAYIAQLKEDDFRKGPEHGSPWECMHPEGNHRQNPVYLTSVSCPLAAFRRIRDEAK